MQNAQTDQRFGSTDFASNYSFVRCKVRVSSSPKTDYPDIFRRIPQHRQAQATMAS